MSVVYLPEDKRWSLVGQGLGSLVGSFVSKKLIDSDNQRVLAGIQQINQDDTIKPEDKPYRVGEVYGTKGLALQQALLKQQQSSIVTQKDVAQTNEALARTSQIKQNTAQSAERAPLERANITSQIQTREGLAPLQRANLASEINTRETETPLKAQNLQLEGQQKATELSQQQSQRDALARLFAADPDSTAKATGMTTEQLHNVLLGGALGGPRAAASGIEAQTRAQTQLQEVGPKEEARLKAKQEATKGTVPLPTQIANNAANASRLAAGLESTLAGVETDPKATGGPLNIVKSFLTEQGFLTNDPVYAQILANTHQIIQQAATSGGGFMSAERIKLAKDVSPSLQKGKVYSIFEANALADDSIAYLQTMRENYKAQQFNTGSIDKAIADMQKIKDKTGTLWSSADGKVLFYQNRRVDPTTLKPLPDGQIKLGGHNYTTEQSTLKIGDTNYNIKDILDASRAKGLTPEQGVEALRVLSEGGNAASIPK